MELRARLGPAPAGSGFRMDGWFVWCGSLIEVDGEYHLFAARWPVATGFPDGYRTHSQIVRATARHPLGPYTFQEVVLGPRGGEAWDGAMAHNPAIYRCPAGPGRPEQFLLYYIGSREGSRHREIGLATAENIAGPWQRPERPLDLGVQCDANNPAALLEADGSVKLVWRTSMLRVCISTAPRPQGPYTLANENVWPGAQLEDFYFFRRGGRYHILCEDNVGGVTGHVRWGCRLVSDNGIDGWRVYEPEALAYSHTIPWTSGGSFAPRRRERPWLLVENGAATTLLTGVYDGSAAWSQPVPIVPPWPME